MPAPMECPGMECWQALFGDLLPADHRERYERHLESCPSCQERLDRPEEFGHKLRRLARRVGDPTAAPADATLVQVVDRLLHEGGCPGRTAAAGPADLYFLRATDRPGSLGTLGDYEVEEVIGQGGMGVVLKAFEPALHRLVAIKVLAPALAGSATARLRFTREAQAAAAVCHDHIVAVYGVHETDGLPYLVMQYVAGESLQARLDRSGPLEVVEVVRIGLQTASGLAAAHAQGLIHRDIKPANLLLEDGLTRVKITDFGLARMADDVGLTQNGVVAGTPEYMAPEQARGEPVDHRADLFSLGSVLYALCTGVQPFRGSTALAVLRQVCEQEPASIRSLNPNVPAWLEALVMRLLAKDPAHRFQSAAEVASLLEGYLAHLRQPVTVPAPVLPPTPRNGARWFRRPLWLVVVGLILLAGLGLSNRLLRQKAPSPGQALKEEFYQDFRGGKPLHPAMKWEGTNGEEVIEPQDKGLRVKLPANRQQKGAVGIELKAPVAGNFEVTLGYEILEIHKPRNAWGAGVELYVTTQTDTREAIAFACGKRPDGRDMYLCSQMTTRDGKRQLATDPKFMPASARSGQLRISRAGEEATLWASEGSAGPFREVCRFNLGPDDLRVVRVAVFPGNPSQPLDVRFIDLRVRSDGPLPESPRDAGAGPGAEQKAVPKGWLVAVELVGGLGVTLALAGLGVWAYRRRARRAADAPAPAARQDGPANAGPVPRSVSFSCPGCEKNLKAKAELAGKRVKCPQCSKGVLVPALEGPR